jgi:biopolymer transport protein ExbD
MKSFRRHVATVNAGSMADIAFLLLIFFLVTTTISADKGILRKLPGECPSNEECTKNRHERNILRISLNRNQEVMIENDVAQISDIRNRVKAFADNNGASHCSYCKGIKSPQLSDHPKDAVISLGYNTRTKYELFITVQDEITKAYYDLRAAYAKKTYNKAPEELTHYELESLKKAYPLVLLEFIDKNSN